MGEVIYIKDLKPEVKLKLKTMASQKGLSLNKFVKIVLEDFVIAPESRNINDKYAEICNTFFSLYEKENQELKEIIAENSYLLQKVNDKIEKI